MLWFRILSTNQLITTDPQIKKRLKKTVIKYAIILGIAIAYLIFVLCTNIGIPCIINKLTGFKCPGCGISRMLVSLISFDIVAAFWHNPFLFVTGPFIIVYLVCSEVKYIKYGNRRMGKWEIFMWIELVLLLAFGILRNILKI